METTGPQFSYICKTLRNNMKKGKTFKVVDSSTGEEKKRQFLFVPAVPDVFKIIVLISLRKVITLQTISQSKELLRKV